MAFTPKASIATRLWLGILAVVLFLLFVETRSPQQGASNFVISTDPEANGADVLIDGQKLGVIGTHQGSGPGGGVFWGHLTRGKHTVELNKPGFKSYSKEIDMRGEAYLGVDLQPAKD